MFDSFEYNIIFATEYLYTLNVHFFFFFVVDKFFFFFMTRLFHESSANYVKVQNARC